MPRYFCRLYNTPFNVYYQKEMQAMQLVDRGSVWRRECNNS